jgi:hypothetical protein
LRIAQPIRYVGGEMEIAIATAASLEVEQDERLIRRVCTGAIAPVNRSAS